MMRRCWQNEVVVLAASTVLAAGADWRLDGVLGTVVGTAIAVAGIVALSLLVLRLFDRVQGEESNV
jgi:hypothetical protein